MKQRPFQTDNVNCGVYAMCYLHCIGANIPFDLNFDPAEYRKLIAHNLLLRSDLVIERCLYCFGKQTFPTINCKNCGRKAHEECYITKQEEKKLVSQNQTKKRRSRKQDGKIKIQAPIDFQCELCFEYEKSLVAEDYIK